MHNTFSLALAKEYVSSTDPFPVDFDDAWQWLDYSRKDSAKKSFDKCGFAESLDYSQFRQSVELVQGGNTYKQVIKLSVECFKTWAMMSQTEKGKQVRLYFLECEKVAKDNAIASPKLPQTYLEALKALVVSEEQKLLLEGQNKALAETIEKVTPLVKYAEAVTYSQTSVEFGDFAKMIKKHGGRNTVMRKCRELGVLMKNSTLPYQRFIDAGYFEVSQEIDENGRLIPFATITGKGQIWLHQKLIAHDQITKDAINGIANGVLSFSL